MSQVRQQNIVGRWCPSAGATGPRLLDRSGRGNHGTLTNMDSASDWVVSGGKGALDFDGVNDYVDCGNQVPFFPTTHTMSMWVLWRDTSSFDRAWSYYDSGPTFYKGFGNNWAIVFTGQFAWSPSPSVPMNNGVWQHVVYTRRGTDASMFTDGVLRATGSINATFSQTNTVRIGASTSNFEPTSMIGDDFIIFNTALTASEVLEVYRRGRGYGIGASPHRSRRPAAGFKAYWANRRSQLIGGGV